LRIIIFLLTPAAIATYSLCKGFSLKSSGILATLGAAGMLLLLTRDFFGRGVGVIKRSNAN
jgi:hypothetical protein